MSDHHASSCNHGHAAEETAAEPESLQVDASRRIVWGTLAAGGAAVSAATMSIPYVSTAQAQGLDPVKSGVRNHYHLAATDKTVQRGYFSKKLKPVVTVDSGDFVTVEAITHHAYDDYERLIKGDPGVESIFHWDNEVPAARKQGRMGAARIQLCQLPRGSGRGCAIADLREIFRRSGHAGCFPQGAPFSDDHPGVDRGRGDFADHGRRGLRHYPGGGRQLGCACHRQEALFAGR